MIHFYTEEKEIKTLKHKWVYNAEQSIRFETKGWFTKAYICKVCDCVKINSKRGKITSDTFIRNGRIGKYIECINMEIENQKTID